MVLKCKRVERSERVEDAEFIPDFETAGKAIEQESPTQPQAAKGGRKKTMAKRPKFVFSQRSSTSPASTIAPTTAVPTPVFKTAQTPPTTTSVPASMPFGLAVEQLKT